MCVGCFGMSLNFDKYFTGMLRLPRLKSILGMTYVGIKVCACNQITLYMSIFIVYKPLACIHNLRCIFNCIIDIDNWRVYY